MPPPSRPFFAVILLGLLGCGPRIPNAIPIAVQNGPPGTPHYVNTLFASVTVCVPGDASRCQTIDGVQVDTGATGLSLLSSALKLPLPLETDASGATIYSCTLFVQSDFAWGPVALADVKLADETAKSLPIHIVADPSSPDFAPPTSCENDFGVNLGRVVAAGANGRLGLSFYRHDCGELCTMDATTNLYHACTGSSCSQTLMPLDMQLQNPVWRFEGGDNNGVIVSLQPIGAGASGASGTLFFGIGTRANNSLKGAPVLRPYSDGTLVTLYDGLGYPSFIDSGAPPLSILDAQTLGLPLCDWFEGRYCPSAPMTFLATLMGVDGATQAVGFTISDAQACIDSRSIACGQYAGEGAGLGYVSWGLPFFFGRSIAIAIEGQSTPAGQGPYWSVEASPR